MEGNRNAVRVSFLLSQNYSKEMMSPVKLKNSYLISQKELFMFRKPHIDCIQLRKYLSCMLELTLPKSK